MVSQCGFMDGSLGSMSLWVDCCVRGGGWDQVGVGISWWWIGWVLWWWLGLGGCG